MAEETKQPEPQEENPFDALAAIMQPAESYEDAYKRVWTAMKSGTLSEEKIVKILLSACAMPALCAANIKMEQILRAHGLVAEQPQDQQAAPTEEAPAPPASKEPEEVHRDARILRFPDKGPVVN